MINAYHRKVMEIHIYFWGIYYIVRLAVLNRQPGTKYINVWRTPKQMGLYFMKKMLVIKKANSNNVRFYNLDRYSISNKKSQPKNKFDCALRKTLFIVSLNISKANCMVNCFYTDLIIQLSTGALSFTMLLSSCDIHTKSNVAVNTSTFQQIFPPAS